MLFARDMSIIWMGDRRYWKWTQIPVDETSNEVVDAAELLAVCWLEVEAKFDTKKLSPGITYEVGFVIMLMGTSYGWEVPVCLEMQLENGIKQERKENFLTKPRNRWIEIPVGEFFTAPENEGEMKISLTEHRSGKWKSGLVIKGIRIQPKI
ncbi:Protein PHLOEM PROTEIN 2-LIKE like [Melia azedarach]|nr:Protein PHLOEM PROTEIN 2-LIKE like [Melia azedarach]